MLWKSLGVVPENGRAVQRQLKLEECHGRDAEGHWTKRAQGVDLGG